MTLQQKVHRFLSAVLERFEMPYPISDIVKCSYSPILSLPLPFLPLEAACRRRGTRGHMRHIPPILLTLASGH